MPVSHHPVGPKPGFIISDLIIETIIHDIFQAKYTMFITIITIKIDKICSKIHIS